MDGYRRFYSLRRGLGYLLHRRFGDLVAHLWGWWFIRRWQREPVNRQYIKALGAFGERAAAVGSERSGSPVLRPSP